MEAYVTDVSEHASQTTGKLYCGDFAQIVKQNTDGEGVAVEHGFYTIDEDGIVRKMGSLLFSESSVNLSVSNSTSGEQVSVLQVSESGVVINGAMDVSGGTTSFTTASFEVSDIDLTLGYDSTDVSDLEGGGLVLGNDDVGKKTFTYSDLVSSWCSNISLRVAADAEVAIDSLASLSAGGLHLKDSSAGIYMGSGSDWKISVDADSNNMKFEHYDTETSAYVLKMELKCDS
ncbi:unknown [Feldmannia species virus]|uniref:Uncharacterized protein n=1 Tax=Feldmannia species virus TaxID=39420 RepID=B5LWE3_9PHYC|nr:hypothetical protein FeldSpV_gp054 [Feldmannia species virus]ACH46806.1 unknown [Feldmannia species virus]